MRFRTKAALILMTALAVALAVVIDATDGAVNADGLAEVVTMDWRIGPIRGAMF